MNQVFFGDCRETMKRLIADGVKVQTCVTSPPYWGLRDYGAEGQMGLEKTPREYVEKMVEVFGMVRELLAEDGTLWLNLGDSYAGSWGAQSRGDNYDSTTLEGQGNKYISSRQIKAHPKGTLTGSLKNTPGLKPKDLVGIPWMVAFALRDAGWYLRCDIIWHKPNPMPESVTDRPTKSHEYLFLMSKSERYYYDAEAVKEPVTGNSHVRGDGINPKARWKTPDGWDTSTGAGGHGSFHKDGREKGKIPGKNSRLYQDRDPKHPAARKHKQNESFSAAVCGLVDSRNKRSVWTVSTAPFSGAHFATFPPALIEPCILAGSRPGDIVLDPFFGSGTTGQVAEQLGRQWIGCEIQQNYEPLQKQRTAQKGFIL